MKTKTIQFYEKFSYPIIFIISYVFSVSIALIFTYINNNYLNGESGTNLMTDESLLYKFVLVFFVSPFIETLLFNSIPYHLFKIITSNQYLIILFASLLFSLAHYYSILYMFMAFLGGLILCSFN